MVHNSILGSSHSMSTSALIEGGMITLYHTAGQGQSWVNGDFVQNYDALIGCSKEESEKTLETFLNLPLELMFQTNKYFYKANDCCHK